MDIKIKLVLDDRNLRPTINRFSSAAARADQSAISRASLKIQTELVDRAYQKINLSKSELKKSILVKGQSGQITITPDSISLSKFLPSEPRRSRSSKGVAVKLWRDRNKIIYVGSFAAYGKGGNLQIFKRLGKDRLPIQKLTGKGLRDMLEIPSFSDGIIEIAQSTYTERFLSSFNAFISEA